MNYFLTIKDSDIFENPSEEPQEYIVRPTSKGIVFDDEGNIALLSIRDHVGFPGGGVEEGETFEEAFIRECDEEIGCAVDIISTIGKARQYRAKDAKQYEFVYFIAKVVGEIGVPSTSQDDEVGIKVIWLSKEKTGEILERQIKDIPENEYARQFNFRTHVAAFKKYLELDTKNN